MLLRVHRVLVRRLRFRAGLSDRWLLAAWLAFAFAVPALALWARSTL